MSILEISTEQKAVEYALKLGYVTWKNAPPGQRGWQDRVFINKCGSHIYIEFKRKGKQLRKLQDYRRQQLQDRGCHVYGPVDDLESAKLILNTHANF